MIVNNVTKPKMMIDVVVSPTTKIQQTMPYTIFVRMNRVSMVVNPERTDIQPTMT